jgi:DNA (cytosine-5)-methyltransferase 1
VKAIDLFAGFGGFTLAAERADLEVVWAANHWPLAVDVHRRNHPHIEHVCQDLRQADWTRLPDFDVLIGAPACQPHSTASQPGRRPHHDADRATAWAIVDCADATSPRAIVVENVPTFRAWRLYPVWRLALQRLGYHVSELVLVASRHGVPQRRERLFIVATRTRRPIEVPVDPHEPAFGPCIDWSAPGWRPVARASAGARERIAKGRRMIGARFLVHHVTRSSPVPLDEPIRTITTKDQWALVDGDRYRPLALREYTRAQTIPDTYQLPSASRATIVRGVGNAVPPELGARVLRAVAEAA